MARYIRYSMLTIFSAIVLLILFFVVTEYRPKPHENILTTSSPTKISADTLTIITWNIGYAGLGKEMDFFFDGGKKVRDTKDATEKNLKAIKQRLQEFDVDFIILQEIDKCSKRSHKIDQVSSIEAALPRFNSNFCLNYNSIFVPTPTFEPYGKVVSGLMTLSTEAPQSATRISLGSKYPWPRRLFMPKRAMLETRFLLASGKELVLLNTHCEAFDSGNLRRVEMKTIRAKVQAEYAKGNVVIVGGDWNQNPPGVSTPTTKDFNPIQIAQDYAPVGWSWAYPSEPTNRYLYEPYKQGETLTTLLDFFLLSPNIKPLSINRIDLGFENSDHNPVIMKFMLYNKAD